MADKDFKKIWNLNVEMKHIKLFEAHSEENPWTLGNIVTLLRVRNQPDAVIIEESYGRNGRRLILVLKRDLKKVLDGDSKLIGEMKSVHETHLKVVGKITPKELKTLQGLWSDRQRYLNDKEAERYDHIKIQDKISPDRARGTDIREIKMQNGEYARVGDTVVVQFSNGKFSGDIKSIHPEGWIMWVAPGRKQARRINPNKILRKLSPEDRGREGRIFDN